MDFTPTKPLNKSLEENIKRVIEGKQETVKNSDGDTVKSDLSLVKHQGNKHAYLSLTGDLKEKGRNTPSMMGAIHHEILKAHPDGKYHQAARYHLHTYAPGTPEHGAPIHAEANAHYHAGIGQYASESANNLANHLVTTKEHAQSIIDSIRHLNTDEQKKKVVNAHVDAMRPKWAADMDKIVATHNLKVENK